MKKQLVLTLAFVGALAQSIPASASPITFSASGFSASDPSRQQAGTVIFDIGAGFLDITLINDATYIGAIGSVLDGLAFTAAWSGAPGAFTLTGFGSAAGALDCTADVPVCSPTATGAAPFGWAWVDAPAQAASDPPLGLYAGAGSLKPYAIVNPTIDGSDDGLDNPPHNPYLLGPVTFTLTFTGTLTDISAATLYFGTGGEFQRAGCTGCLPLPPPPQAVPEPGSLILLGTGLAGAAARLRKRLHR